jgi:hypothetical protein
VEVEMEAAGRIVPVPDMAFSSVALVTIPETLTFIRNPTMRRPFLENSNGFPATRQLRLLCLVTRFTRESTLKNTMIFPLLPLDASVLLPFQPLATAISMD